MYAGPKPSPVDCRPPAPPRRCEPKGRSLPRHCPHDDAPLERFIATFAFGSWCCCSMSFCIGYKSGDDERIRRCRSHRDINVKYATSSNRFTVNLPFSPRCVLPAVEYHKQALSTSIAPAGRTNASCLHVYSVLLASGIFELLYVCVDHITMLTLVIILLLEMYRNLGSLASGRSSHDRCGRLCQTRL